MKRLIFLLLLVFCFNTENSMGMQHAASAWKVINANEFQTFSNYIRFATRTAGQKAKTICLLVYSGDEFYADIYKSSSQMHALQQLIERLANAGSELEFIGYAHGNHKDASNYLADFINFLAKQYQSKETSFIFIAHGPNPDIVNRACHVISPTVKIDSLIYFQPTIYETYVTPTGIKENADSLSRPKGFKKLYNLYAKTGDLVVYNPIYSERKFRQQADLVNHSLIMRVKNVRMLKIANKQLEDYSNQDFFSVDALKNLPTLLTKIDQYMLNFDLLAIGFNHGMSPLVLINRFVSLNGSRVRAHYGIYPFEGYYDVKLRIPEELMKNLAHQFSVEFKRSQDALHVINQLPAAKGYGIMKQLGAEMDDLKRRYQNVETHGLQAVEQKGDQPAPVQVAPPPPPLPGPKVSPAPPPAPPAPKLPIPAKPAGKPGVGELGKGKEGLRKVITAPMRPSQEERWNQFKAADETVELKRELHRLTRQLIKAQFAKENKREIDQLATDIAFLKGLLNEQEEEEENWD